jgi:hypothetical protein
LKPAAGREEPPGVRTVPSSHRPDGGAEHQQERAAMHASPSGTQPYVAPRLKVYGTVADITLTNANDKNKNDSIQGQNNLKT